MRIPFSKLYRSFRELDGFSDSECERFVLQAVSQRPGMFGWTLLAGVALAGLWIFFLIPLAIIGRIALGIRGDDASALALCALIAVAALGTFLPSLWVRDALLIRTIRDRIFLARCPFCRHSLLGLPLLSPDGRETVRCPECGRVVVLDEIGLTHAELIPRGVENAALRAGSPIQRTDQV